MGWNGRFSKKFFATQSVLILYSWTENFQIEGVLERKLFSENFSTQSFLIPFSGTEIFQIEAGLKRKIFKENLCNSVIFNPIFQNRNWSDNLRGERFLVFQKSIM